MASTAGADDQLDIAGGLDDQLGCGFMLALFAGGLIGSAIFGAIIFS